MPAPRRSKTEREADLYETARLDRRGYSQRDIAGILNVSRSQVSYDLARIRRDYLKARQHERAALVEEKRQQLREARREAWDAWEKSKENARRVVQEKVQDGGGSDTRQKTVTTVEGQLPDPAYLRAVLETLRDESALLGLDAPRQVDARVALNWDELWKRAGDGEFDGVERELAEHEARLREGGGPPAAPEGEGTT